MYNNHSSFNESTNASTNTSFADRVKGLFMGQIVGDALGTRYEFSSSKKATKNVLRDINEDDHLELLGGGPFNVAQGQYTDDSELALGVWDSLLTNKRCNMDDISSKFYNWYESDPFDIGNATRSAFKFATTRDIMKKNAVNYNSESLSNGCLMKISPIGALLLFGENQTKTLSAHAKELCELTNPHPLCIDMCVSYVHAIDTALKSGNNMGAYMAALLNTNNEFVKQILNDALKTNTTVALQQTSNKQRFVAPDDQEMGYIGIAFQNAFFQLTHYESFEKSMIDTIILGGDTDTNCCIAGALIAACYGVNSIPKEWIKLVENFKQTDNVRLEIYPSLNHNKIYNMLNKFLSQNNFEF